MLTNMKTTLDKNALDMILKICNDSDVQPAYPTWAGQQRGLSKEYYQNGHPVTWCNRFLYRVLVTLGKSTEEILCAREDLPKNLVQSLSKDRFIDYTDARTMVERMQRNLRRIRRCDLLHYVCEEDVAVCGLRVASGHAHVGLAVGAIDNCVMVLEAGEFQPGIYPVSHSFPTDPLKDDGPGSFFFELLGEIKS